MKRQTNLLEKIAATENLELAWFKAQKGKADREAVIAYGRQLWKNLQKLQQQILTGQIETGNYHYFTIFDPKKRLICAAPLSQRVLHHALMNVCHPHFEKVQIFDSYASRPNKGTYAALERAQNFNYRFQWFLKLDFRKYFDSLYHFVMKTQLCRLFKEPPLLAIFSKIIDSYAVTENRGVPIGNLTSQYFANHYLAPLDHFVKEELKIKAYVRYMDDLVLWHPRKEMLLSTGRQLQQYAAEQLNLTLKPFCLNQNTRGLPFLGYLLFPEGIRLSSRSRKRFIQKLRRAARNLRCGNWSQAEFQAHVTPLIAFTEFANAKAFRQKVISEIF